MNYIGMKDRPRDAHDWIFRNRLYGVDKRYNIWALGMLVFGSLSECYAFVSQEANWSLIEMVVAWYNPNQNLKGNYYFYKETLIFLQWFYSLECGSR